MASGLTAPYRSKLVFLIDGPNVASSSSFVDGGVHGTYACETTYPVSNGKEVDDKSQAQKSTK
jgi:hypothetical protein